MALKNYMYLYSLHSITRNSSHMLLCEDGGPSRRSKTYLSIDFPFKHVVKIPSKHTECQWQTRNRSVKVANSFHMDTAKV